MPSNPIDFNNVLRHLYYFQALFLSQLCFKKRKKRKWKKFSETCTWYIYTQAHERWIPNRSASDLSGLFACNFLIKYSRCICGWRYHMYQQSIFSLIHVSSTALITDHNAPTSQSGTKEKGSWNAGAHSSITGIIYNNRELGAPYKASW